MHQHHFLMHGQVGVGIFFAGLTVGGPTGVADSHGVGKLTFFVSRNLLFQFF